ncbi:MAG TPA: DUF1843 domain-containing protein [Pyrinomonadaceae bacterium]|nr:DUF1843 domain-containing protein [Pyrinomonadaceae bacterium]
MAVKKVTKSKAAPASGAVPPYGPPIKEAIARGNVAEMKAMAKSARKWLTDVQKALEALDKAIARK